MAKRAFVCGFVIGRTPGEPCGIEAEMAFERWWTEVGQQNCLESFRGPKYRDPACIRGHVPDCDCD